jgi:iron complex transport system substrate-binding protein
LVVISVDSTKAPQIRDALVKLGIPVLMEKAPANLKDVYAENTMLGRVTDRQSGAVKLNAAMAKSIKDVLAKAKKKTGIRIFHELDDTYYSVTSNTFIGKVYKDFGAVNIADAASGADSSGYPQLSAEYLVKSDPQVIFLADAQYGVTAESVSKRAGWSQISAIKNKKIVELPADIPSRWGPRLVDFYKLIGTSLANEHSRDRSHLALENNSLCGLVACSSDVARCLFRSNLTGLYGNCPHASWFKWWVAR